MREDKDQVIFDGEENKGRKPDLSSAIEDPDIDCWIKEDKNGDHYISMKMETIHGSVNFNLFPNDGVILGVKRE